MHHTKTIPSDPGLKNESAAAFRVDRISVMLCILTIFLAGFCAAHLARDVQDARSLIAFMVPDEGTSSQRLQV